MLAVASSMWAIASSIRVVAVSAHYAHALCVLLCPECGLSKPLCRPFQPMYMLCKIHGGYCILYDVVACSLWDFMSSMWNVAAPMCDVHALCELLHHLCVLLYSLCRLL